MSSDYLFARPSFLHGMARTLDVWGSLDPFNWSRSPHEADAVAMQADWSLVGQDLATAMESFGAELQDPPLSFVDAE
jgi:hypothetical protein